MADTLRVNVNLTPAGSIGQTFEYTSSSDNISKFPTIACALAYGSGVQQANNWAILASTVGPSGNWDIDLTDLDNIFGAVQFNNVKILLFHLDSPDGSLTLNIGPGASNGFDLISTDAEQVYSTYYKENIYNGWGLDASHCILRVANPTASAVAVSGWVVGIE